MAERTQTTQAGGHSPQTGANTEPEDMLLGGRINRTGIATAPMRAKAMAQSTFQEPDPFTGSQAFAAARARYAEDAEPVGTMPPPANLKGVAKATLDALKGDKSTVLLDKIGERLAFERSGTRLYEGLIHKFDSKGGFPGGPSREELVGIRDDEARHFAMLREVMTNLGGDPTAMTPSADITAVEAMGLVQVISDPRTTLAQSLHAILIAELADGEAWRMLIELTTGFGKDDIAQRFRQAEAEETRHLEMVRRWVTAHANAAAGLANA